MEFFTFNGRCGRLEYFGISVLAAMVHVFNVMLSMDFDAVRATGRLEVSPLFLVGFVFATLISWTAAIRRCHDVGRSGFFLLWQFVPLLGIAAALFLIFARGDDMKNRFGPPPWSITNRAEKRMTLERAALQAQVAQQVNPEEAWVAADGSFDMDGLWNESDISR